MVATAHVNMRTFWACGICQFGPLLNSAVQSPNSAAPWQPNIFHFVDNLHGRRCSIQGYRYMADHKTLLHLMTAKLSAQLMLYIIHMCTTLKRATKPIYLPNYVGGGCGLRPGSALTACECAAPSECTGPQRNSRRQQTRTIFRCQLEKKNRGKTHLIMWDNAEFGNYI